MYLTRNIEMPNRNIVFVSFLMLSEEESSELQVLNPDGVKKKQQTLL